MAKKTTKSLTPKYRSGTSRNVWLTLDDGPHRTNTPRILATLKRHGIKATFFVIGNNAKSQMKLLEQMVEAGHRIGNHTMTHPFLTRLSRAAVVKEISRAENLLGDLLGKDKIFRPPYGDTNKSVNQVIAELGYSKIMWNVDTLDWNAKFKPDGWIQHGIDQTRERTSCLVLNHDIHTTTARHFDDFILRINKLGGVKYMDPHTL